MMKAIRKRVYKANDITICLASFDWRKLCKNLSEFQICTYPLQFYKDRANNG